MIKEYENWEDSIRRTFIELADYMNKITDPLETIIDFAWSAGADLFWVNNAKDELKRLRGTKPLESNEALDQLLSLCETAVNTGRWNLTSSLVYNAKANLEQLRNSKKDLAKEVYKANNFATEELNLYLETSKELGDLQKKLASPVAWARINNRGDLFDLRLQNNPYIDQNSVIPLYRLNQ